MASFLKDMINNAANSVNKDIQEKIENGTFNRIAEGVGSGVNKAATGLVAFVGMAEKAFMKLKESATKSKEEKMGPAARLAAEADSGKWDDEQPVENYGRTASPVYDGEPVSEDEDDDEYEYEPGLAGSDDFIDQLARAYELEDREIYIFSFARLMVQTGLFFAQCDGNYTKKERACIEELKEMAINCIEDVNCEALEHIFDGAERRYCLNDIIEMTHRLIDHETEKERKSVIGDLSEFICKIVDAEERGEDTPELDLYRAWRKEFID